MSVHFQTTQFYNGTLKFVLHVKKRVKTTSNAYGCKGIAIQKDEKGIYLVCLYFSFVDFVNFVVVKIVKTVDENL